MQQVGTITYVNGPVVRARVTGELQMMEQVEVGPEGLIGEVIALDDDLATIQVYEDTAGLVPGDALQGTGMPLGVELGPGLIGSIIDGIERPLVTLAEIAGEFIPRGVVAPALDRERTWSFTPTAVVGDHVSGGATLGTVPETPLLRHSIMVPPDVSGDLVWLADQGDYTVDSPIARVRISKGERELTMMQRWPVRSRRPVAGRLSPNEPLITGQRVIDALFPMAKGGTAAIPGGFGAGKTVLQQGLAKWSDAQVVIYVGCGERGNEMTDVLEEFPELQDPQTGHSLMERTILIANTSNMPVAAREASIYTGITLAEYYRDMGYHVALMADSTSRWAEALREVSGRLEEMPAEEGFPAYLPSRLASFYERAGRVRTLGGQVGSVTVVGAVSPPAGDLSEPVTQHTRRFVRTFWALDKNLAAARHFPAVNWMASYSGYTDTVADWWSENVSPEWTDCRQHVSTVLHRESELQEIVRLVGPDALPDDQRWLLWVARLVREGFLQQNAMDPVDAYTTPLKQMALLQLILHAMDRGREVLAKGAPVSRLENEIDVWPKIIRAASTVPNDDLSALDDLRDQLDAQIDALLQEYQS
ncbi:MAG: V-type ATP synthase subunit A [Anaerolineae bacterium]